MKKILEQTRTNLIEIRDKMCYNDSDGTKCYKCEFGKFLDNIDKKHQHWLCSLQTVINALNYHLSFFPEDKK